MASFSRPCIAPSFTSLHRLSYTRLTRSLSLQSRFCSNAKASKPLDILFYGSDQFSCASLRALADEQAANPALVRSINVVVRPGKPFGRGMKRTREVPLKTLAQELLKKKKKKTNAKPPTAYNLIVAVSFGLLIPSRLICAAEYGGLNLHPSMLPDFRGAAPLHHTLLQGRKHIGISLQTLHETSFDRGTILAQTPFPGLPVPENCTLAELYDIVTAPAAAMLVDGLRAGVHVSPHRHVGWTPPADYTVREARRLGKTDGCVDWARWTAEQVERRVRVLGTVWTVLRNDKAQKLRVQLTQVENVEEDVVVPIEGKRVVIVGEGGAENSVVVRGGTIDGGIVLEMSAGGLLKVQKVKVEGKTEGVAANSLVPFQLKMP
ncbi:hypothetical protein TD95_001194 [Thielaviopsis punctulata]|uniref:Formyl transferase N-terminal domain-containing protein n=1 Tax=Thielaviopsis punctulata TaxID=72032 RepID=A0A0F4ZDJ4_9PEZI|nr:hypothetical protein TD95_001194 [Thielaviopsis punctulata]